MVAPAIAILLLLLSVSWCLVGNYIRLMAIPGPRLAGWSDFWHKRAQNASNFGRLLTTYHWKYGPLVRLGPNCVSLADPESVSYVHGRQLHEEGNETVQQTIEGAAQYEGVVDQLAADLMENLQRQRVIELTASFRFFVKNFVGRLILDDLMERTAYLRNEVHSGRWFHTLKGWFAFPTIEYLVLGSPGARLKMTRGGLLSDPRLMCLPEMGSNARSNSKNSPGQRARSVGEYRRLQTTVASINCINAAFVSVFRALLCHPSILCKLRHELDTASQARILSDPPQWVELNRLRYLDAVMMEVIRLFSPGHSVKTIAPEGGITIAGFHVPEDTVVLSHSDTMRRNSEIFGPGSQAFQPDRWLAIHQCQRRRMEDNLFPFSQGIRSCPEGWAAWKEVKKVVAMIIMRFEMRSVHVEGLSGPTTSEETPPTMVSFAVRPGIH
ncbi:cytochrome P450 [Aspergillus campestris IBT 28561]|uniref:Cytochrome P450 n=1 Tax=Aspergillus campestris (strain IBT 28561) TaxID=1392248 RepID=A0A2I1CTP6_ASPC2|nr:cytochrome P450 [Aspergillus campestris IBT 28561]PKY01003.1 cytochrome P450 [Aspergillus campestris IBT 28561]